MDESDESGDEQNQNVENRPKELDLGPGQVFESPNPLMPTPRKETDRNHCAHPAKRKNARLKFLICIIFLPKICAGECEFEPFAILKFRKIGVTNDGGDQGENEDQQFGYPGTRSDVTNDRTDANSARGATTHRFLNN